MSRSRQLVTDETLSGRQSWHDSGPAMISCRFNWVMNEYEWNRFIYDKLYNEL